MFSRDFWQTFVQLLSFNGYILPNELHHYPQQQQLQPQNKGGA